MTLQQLRKVYREAHTYRTKYAVAGVIDRASEFALTIEQLCLEIERLKRVADEQNSAYSEFTLMPFGQHKCKRLGDVPDDYLRWWEKQNDRASLQTDVQFGKYGDRMIADMKLRLLDYINKRFSRNDA